MLKNTIFSLIFAIFALILPACGGDDDPNPPTDGSVTTSDGSVATSDNGPVPPPLPDVNPYLPKCKLDTSKVLQAVIHIRRDEGYTGKIRWDWSNIEVSCEFGAVELGQKALVVLPTKEFLIKTVSPQKNFSATFYPLQKYLYWESSATVTIFGDNCNPLTISLPIHESS